MQQDKKEKNKKINLDIFFKELLLFFFAIILGMGTAFKLNNVLELQEIEVSPINLWYFILYFIVGTILILLISFFMKSAPRKGKIFKGLFIFAIFWGGLIVLDTWLGSYFLLFGDVLSLFLILFLIFIWIKKQSILIHNICIVLGIAGMGATLGLRMETETVAILLFIFAIYDFIAVYKTKHMVKMAKEMIKHKAILGIIVPKKGLGFGGELKNVKQGGKFLVLGGGDIAFPLIFCVSLISENIYHSFLVFFFSLIGLFFSYFIFFKQKKQKPIPALPPIAAFSILGYLITFFL